MQFSLPAGLNYVTTARALANIDNTVGESPHKCLLLCFLFPALIDSLLEQAENSSDKDSNYCMSPQVFI